MARGKFRPMVLTWDDLQNDEARFPDSDPDNYHQIILAEGDSWFSMGGIPISNVLFELRFDEPTLIVNLARPGDTVRNMSDLAGNDQLREAMAATDIEWDAVLISGGGNDLLDAIDTVLIPPDERGPVASMSDYCSETGLRGLLKSIAEGYQRIAASRMAPGSAGANAAILTHTYAYATPRNSPARFFGVGIKGPWILPAFERNEIPKRHWIRLSDHLLDRLAEGHQAIAAAIDDFHLVDTRNKLNRAILGTSGDSEDWQNEFHPNSDGYSKIAKALEPKLRTLLKP